MTYSKGFVRFGALSGLVSIVANIMAIGFLTQAPTSYQIGKLKQWYAELVVAPEAVINASWAFTIAVLALIPFACALSAFLDGAVAKLGCICIGLAGFMNAIGTLLPLVVAERLTPVCAPLTPGCEASIFALLGTATAMDALFNLLLGSGLILVALGRGSKPPFAKWVFVLAGIAGICTIPVSLQVTSDTMQKMLIVAGPLWLFFIGVASVLLWRKAQCFSDYSIH